MKQLGGFCRTEFARRIRRRGADCESVRDGWFMRILPSFLRTIRLESQWFHQPGSNRSTIPLREVMKVLALKPCIFPAKTAIF
jgi:hypothetical protein